VSDPVIDQVRRVFGDLDEVAERVLAARFAAPLQPMTTGGSEDPTADAIERERTHVLANGVAGLAKVKAGRDEEIDDAERVGLRAIVLQEGRPAIVIQDGDFGDPPALWAQLGAQREHIRAVIGRTGRVEIEGHPDYEWVGTASLVAPATLLTNRHVAHTFCERRRRIWRFRPGMSSHVDFVREHARTSSLAFEVIGTIGVHEHHDLALLRVADTSPDGRALPDPLPVAARQPRHLFERDVYLVGYPMRDDRNDPEPLRRIFGEIFDVKRLQPGRAVGYSTTYGAIEHDCSTLGGNSGSPVIDLETHDVIALHFGGQFAVGNYAVPLWTLTDDPLLHEAEVNFR
jgi:hypothetical protein